MISHILFGKELLLADVPSCQQA